MENRPLHKIECIHLVGTSESEQLKVIALNFFHPTASPPFQKSCFFNIVTQFPKGEDIPPLLKPALPVDRGDAEGFEKVIF